MTPIFPRIWTYAPLGQLAPGPIVASGRAGALGVMDSAPGTDPGVVLAALAGVARFGDFPAGLRLPADEAELLNSGEIPRSLGILILTEPTDGDWSGPIASARTSGRAVVAEVTSRASARSAAGAGADALVVAGHEGGGRVSDDSSFILIQGVLADGGPPTWVRGGIGPRSAAACVAAGAAGVILDGTLLLAREVLLPESTRERVARLDGSESVIVRSPSGVAHRLTALPNSPQLNRLRGATAEGWAAAWRGEVGWGPDRVWPAGQDAALAAGLGRQFGTVGGIIREVERSMDEAPRLAAAMAPLAAGSPLAVAHGTTYPIVQGPMTRVSDSAAFAVAVAEGGALPFLALALLRGPEARTLLADAAERLAGRSWGVGILGFVPPELRREQIEAIRAVRPPFALIAGGRPDQAAELEREGIATYLHAPSPALLRQYLKDGSRRFVLEGRECGGHVGPRSSFTLWEQAADVVAEAIGRGIAADSVHLLFAGGIHDARSAAMVSALAAPLAGAGVKVGVLIGTAYLFTTEAVQSGAIVPGFQAAALVCDRTVLLETGPGHEVRVSPSPFAADFERERLRLTTEGRPADEVRATLERMNAGRLRVAAKGVDRAEGAGSPLVAVGPEDQYERGIYMIGQAATLRDRVTTIAELHREIADGGAAWLDRASPEIVGAEPEQVPADVAIVGMSAIVPGAGDVRTFWENTLRGVDSITEIPADRWDWRLYYDADAKAPDKITSKWGGFLPDVPFDPLRYGMPPNSLPSIEPMQLLMLEAVRAALDDAGYRDREFPRERTAVVLGAGGGAAQLAMGYAFRSYLPMLDSVAPGAGAEALERAKGLLPEWTEDSFPGILLNVAAGRVANRFDLGGANYTVDAACGSSLAAAALAVRELESRAADMVVLGGADTVQNPFTYLAFSKTHAFSPRGRCRPFDASADGIVISEGVAVLVLKRLADAERDGDRIYAMIKGVGASSDGRAKGLTAPHPEGQMRAVRRAYAKAGVDPATVGYVEAHGTGTAAGDAAEIETLTRVFREAGAAPGGCVIGSVKSLIGHTKCAAGLAGLINASLALHHGVLPPTIGITHPNPRADWSEGPFRLNTAARPWLHGDPGHPRRAGVSAFGFGGTNFHAVLEAYEGDPTPKAAAMQEWPAELIVVRARDGASLLEAVGRIAGELAPGRGVTLRAVAAAATARDATAIGLSGSEAPGTPRANHREDRPPGDHSEAASTGHVGPTLALVATSLDDLSSKLNQARRAIAEGQRQVYDPRGVYYAERAEFAGGPVAFLFPGQGAQAPDMLADQAVAFPEVRAGFEAFDAALRRLGRDPVGPRVFGPPAFSEPERARRRAGLLAPEVAQPAVGAACLGLIRLLDALGLTPDLVAGHSYGEFVALHAAGSFSAEALVELSEARGRFLREAAGEMTGAMAAVATGPERIGEVLAGLDGVEAVNWNGPTQTVISGNSEAVGRAVDRAKALGLRAQLLPVASAFHSPLVAGAGAPLASLAAALGPAAPRIPTYSNVTAAPYPADPGGIAALLGEHVARPVRFAEMIEAMHAGGARVFVEAGPGGTLAPLVTSILGDRPHLAVALDRPGRPGLPTLLHALARLAVAGVPLRLGRLTEGRPGRVAAEPHSASTWLVNGTRARPLAAPEPPRLGVGTAATPGRGHGPAKRNGRNGAHANGSGHGFAEPSTIPPRPAGSGSNGSEIGSPAPVARARFELPFAVPSAPADAGAARMVEAFQETMRAFLDVQRSTMLGYLAGRADAPRPPAPRATSPAATAIAASVMTAGETVPARAKPAVLMAVPPLTASSLGCVEPEEETVDRDRVAAELLRIARDRTGYPAEMLRLDLDLEGDLGIDSIKRIEILGSLREALPALGLGADGATMDALARAKTLGAIVDRLGRNLAPFALAKSHARAEGDAIRDPTPGAHAGVGEVLQPNPSAQPPPVRRLLIEATHAPLPGRSARLAPGGVVLVTDDGRGIARDVAADLRALGHPVVQVRHGVASGEVEGINLVSESAVAALLDRVRERGPLAGIVHALPLRELPPAGLDPGAWAARMGPEVRGLFLLARGAAEDLERSAKVGGACLIAATAMGGAFASAGLPPAEFFPGQGGIAGLVKTLAREWPGVRARVVDLDIAADVEVLAADLVQEVWAADPRAEVGYRSGRRIALRTTPAPLIEGPDPAIGLSPGDPVLITGGARGITSAIAADFARRWRPTLLLIGSSPPPTDHEDPITSGLHTPVELMAAIHAAGKAPGPAEVERAYQALRRAREIRVNLRTLRDAGSRVEYAQADVRDAEALGRVLAGWRREFGPPVGLIHGAGVIRDKLLRDKTPESFDRVLGTKVEGALTLARLVEPEALRFAAFFSSVAGRFGNRGQADYAAANEALNKLALWLDGRWPCRVVSMIWGPWSGVGMVSDLEGHLGRRGLGMIPPEVGCTRLADELRSGRMGDVEVLVAGDLGPLEGAGGA